MLQNQETFERTHGTWKTTFVKAPKRVVNNLKKTMPFTFPERDGLDLSKPCRCDTFANQTRCLVRAQELTRNEQEELGQIIKECRSLAR